MRKIDAQNLRTAYSDRLMIPNLSIGAIDLTQLEWTEIQGEADASVR
ncbi:hypothetical protein IQ250_07575 [Pseudanabaenaceae cyanobacterium LEGE 13415]|nr:hypothetical protein [Pseudanabaenaceae cyanobacterium LEGE 13415]